MSSMPPPPPPGPGPGAPMPPQQPWDLGAALSYGWNKYVANVAQIIIAALVLVVGIAVIAIVGALLIGLLVSPGTAECSYDSSGAWRCETDDRTPFLVAMALNLLLGAVLFVVAQIVGAGLIRGALAITEGRPFEVAEVFRTDRLGPVVVTSLILGAATFVGLLLCYVPGLVVAFLTSYSLYFVIDKGLAPVDAIRASVDLVRNNLGTTIVWFIVGGLIAAAGSLICGVGLLLTLPIVLIGTAYTYKTLTGQPVAP
jgi:uncharacterized membrane protein